MKRRYGTVTGMLLAALFAAGILAAWFAYYPIWEQNRRSEEENERLIDRYLKSGEPDETDQIEEQEDEPEEDTEQRKEIQDPIFRRYDFEGLQRINPEIIGWIYVPGTQIDYPVCRGTDDSYYLTHTAEKEENALGAIFVPAETGTELRDTHVLFYGHNMRSGKMFGDLSSYCDPDFRIQYPYVYIYTPEYSGRGIVYSVCRTECDGPAYTIGYQRGTAVYEEWQRETVKASLYDCGYSPDGRQQIVTLSTCTDSGPARDRLVVHCAVTEYLEEEK